MDDNGEFTHTLLAGFQLAWSPSLASLCKYQKRRCHRMALSRCTSVWVLSAGTKSSFLSDDIKKTGLCRDLIQLLRHEITQKSVKWDRHTCGSLFRSFLFSVYRLRGNNVKGKKKSFLRLGSKRLMFSHCGSFLSDFSFPPSPLHPHGCICAASLPEWSGTPKLAQHKKEELVFKECVVRHKRHAEIFFNI